MSGWKQTATIRETAARCKAEGLGVSEWALRGWVRTGKIKYVMAGNKALIYWKNLLTFLESGETTGTSCDSPGALYGNITQIPEKLPLKPTKKAERNIESG